MTVQKRNFGITVTRIAGQRPGRRRSRATTQQVSLHEQIEQALAYHQHDVEATVRAGWDREDVLNAAAHVETVEQESRRLRTLRQAARAELARRYSGTVRQYHHHGGGLA